MALKKGGQNMLQHFQVKLSFFLISFFLLGAVNIPEERRENGEWKSYQGIALGSVNDFRENSIQGVQKVDLKTYRLRIDGLVKRPQSYTYAELNTFPRQKKLVTVHCVEGWQVVVLWEGIPFQELIKRTGADPKANTIIFHAVDGYITSLDYKTVVGKNMLLADWVNGITLPEKLGFPFILVAEDKWGYKWARWIERIEFSDQKDYRGFWEQRGYNNKGNFPGPEREE
jgi:DMSO/TMAO reductase YedYZ molybdopterin-dependent catalytic subunit